jgi:DNA-3-methyladenine glycosylase II
MDSDSGAAHIARVDPAFAAVIQAVGPFTPRPPDADPFNSLARAIVFQQLAGHAARAIHGRFVALFDGQPTPEDVLRASIERLRGVGLSGSKAASMADLALKATDGTVPLDRLDELSDAEIVQRLSAVRGIGRWTAEMFLIFQLRRLDVWPVDDLGIRKGFAAIHRLAAPPTPKALEALGETYRPYRSLAAWYCWRAVDTVLPTA